MTLGQERVIFIICDYKIYHYLGLPDKQVEIVDYAYKFRKVNSNLIAFHTVSKDHKKTNDIRYLNLTYSEFNTGLLYQEIDGKLEEFLI